MKKSTRKQKFNKKLEKIQNKISNIQRLKKKKTSKSMNVNECAQFNIDKLNGFLKDYIDQEINKNILYLYK